MAFLSNPWRKAVGCFRSSYRVNNPVVEVWLSAPSPFRSYSFAGLYRHVYEVIFEYLINLYRAVFMWTAGMMGKRGLLRFAHVFLSVHNLRGVKSLADTEEINIKVFKKHPY